MNDIDVSQIPGYKSIPEDLPDWKKHLMTKKNKDIVTQYLLEKEKEEKEKNKYGDIPQWKKDLLMKKEKEMEGKINSPTPCLDKYGDIPQWKKDMLMKRKEEQK